MKISLQLQAKDPTYSCMSLFNSISQHIDFICLTWLTRYVVVWLVFVAVRSAYMFHT